MKLKAYLLPFLFVVFFSFANAQIIELTFTGKSDTYHVAVDSILVENITQGGDTMLYFPDTVIMLGTVGIEDNDGIEKPKFGILENYPNPFKNQTLIHLNVPETGDVDIFIYNILGKVVATFSHYLSQGIHSFTFSSGSESMFFLTAIYKSEVKTHRMIGVNGDNNRQSVFRYNGILSDIPVKNSFSSIKGVPYNPGDQFRFVGFAYAGKDTIIDAPITNQDYEFEFDNGIPCPGIPTFTYGGQTYNTVQIGTHCWMLENLNIGTRIDGAISQTNNGVIEKYCYNDDTLNCDIYGGLYMWDEIMDYQSIEDVQGICPSGWHIPADTSWTILIDYLGGNVIAGGKMKEYGFLHWNTPNSGASNSSGFTALPAGYASSSGVFYEMGIVTFIWSSTEYSGLKAWDRQLSYNNSMANASADDKGYGFSVRCLQDTCSPLPTQANAGPDSLNIGSESIALMGNIVINGQGLWSVFSGTGSHFADSTNPTTLFFGLPNNIYNLVWTISNACGSSSDTVQIGFGCFLQPNQADAGPDQNNVCSPVILSANIPMPGNGTWSILSGSGGSFSDINNPFSEFSGIQDSSYLLQWTISTICSSTSDVVSISFMPPPTQSNAGPDSLKIVANSIALMGNIAINGQGLWSVFSGTGGSFADATNPTTTFYGLLGNTYDLVWTISNSCGSSSDNVIISFATPFVCGDTLVDIRDWKNYNTVQIGTQCWMAENLTYLPSVSPESAGSETLPYYYVFDYQGTSVSAAKATSNYQTYGVLYNWPAAMAGEAGSNSVPSGVQGVCPAGWHLPSDAEWTVLTDLLGGLNVAGGKMKETGTTHWYSPNTGATNSSGFTALPGGARESLGAFWNLRAITSIWSSTDYSSSNALYRRLYYDAANVDSYGWTKESGFSVRCIENCFQANAGPDSLNIAGDSIALMGNTPVIGQGVWTVINGTGGVFADSTNPTTLFYGLSGMTYNLAWTISNNCGGSSDNVIISFAAPLFVCGDTLLDFRDWKSYNTVQIGTQCWMAENLNIGTMIIGSQYQHDNGIFEKYCYDNDAANCITYGGLYQWDEMMQYVTTPGVQGICPAGWHIPTDDEWKLLEGTVDSQYGPGDPEWDISGVYRGYDAGQNLKSTSGWNSGGNGTDLYGFSALPGGDRYGGGVFHYIGTAGLFWTSTENGGGNSWGREMSYNYSGIGRGDFWDGFGFSVRCLSECLPQPTQSNAGLDSLGIVGDSIALMGNTPVIGQGLWTIFSGTGGSFADTTNPTTMFYGMPAMSYNLVWTISNSCGSSSDTVVISFAAAAAFVCGDPLID
ncbi:MAG: T9SS type A sorting domain-containing protein, partial [Bacteroidales bacterium]|nr:T9SS type A sorting domain-containing protein [Bacteroidales bacterium]